MSEWIKRQDAIDTVAQAYQYESDRITALQELPSIDVENLKEDLMKDRRIGRQSLDAFLEILAKYNITLN